MLIISKVIGRCGGYFVFFFIELFKLANLPTCLGFTGGQKLTEDEELAFGITSSSKEACGVGIVSVEVDSATGGMSSLHTGVDCRMDLLPLDSTRALLREFNGAPGIDNTFLLPDLTIIELDIRAKMGFSTETSPAVQLSRGYASDALSGTLELVR